MPVDLVKDTKNKGRKNKYVAAARQKEEAATGGEQTEKRLTQSEVSKTHMASGKSLLIRE